MISRELKHFHNENRTHVTKKEYSGVEITAENAVNAPMDLKIYGASYQKVTKQGKNLFDMDKKFDDVIPSLAHNTAAYQCDKEKVSETEWRFYNFTKGGNDIAYFVMPFSTKKNTDYVLSLTVNGLGLRGYIGIDTRTTSNTTTDQWNLAVKNWKDIITETETDIRTSFSFNSRNYELLYFRGYFTQGIATDESYCLFKEMQLEEGNTLTDYEPFVPDAPTEEYPSLIYPSKEMTLKCTGGNTLNSTKIPLIGNAMEVSDIAQSNLVLDGKYYLSDYIEYNSATDKAYRHKFIDDTLLNTALPVKDQTQAILAKPTVEEITAGNGEYSFKDAKSVQDGFTLTTESYSTDGLPHPKPMCIESKIKVIKG